MSDVDNRKAEFEAILDADDPVAAMAEYMLNNAEMRMPTKEELEAEEDAADKLVTRASAYLENHKAQNRKIMEVPGYKMALVKVLSACGMGLEGIIAMEMAILPIVTMTAMVLEELEEDAGV